MIAKLAQCLRCKGVIYRADEVGLVWTADLNTLDAQTALHALLDGRQVYVVLQPGNILTTARPEDLSRLREANPPMVVASHPCPAGASKVLEARLPAPEGEGEGGAPKEPARPSAVPSRPSSGPSTEPSGAQTAVKHRSDPVCDGCGKPCADGTYASIELGDLLVWAHHVENCA